MTVFWEEMKYLELDLKWEGNDVWQKLLKLGTWIKYTVQSKDSEVLQY